MFRIQTWNKLIWFLTDCLYKRPNAYGISIKSTSQLLGLSEGQFRLCYMTVWILPMLIDVPNGFWGAGQLKLPPELENSAV